MDVPPHGGTTVAHAGAPDLLLEVLTAVVLGVRPAGRREPA